MKKQIVWLLALVMLLFFAVPLQAAASEKNSSSSGEDPEDIVEQIKGQLEEMFEGIDQETASETFSFLKEKLAEGSFATEEGLLDAIEEGKEKFGIEIGREDAQKLVDAMEKLEDMGFSADYLIEKAESLYEEYGSDFIEHADEVVGGAVKNAVSNAVSGFFDNLINSVKNFFTGLFS